MMTIKLTVMVVMVEHALALIKSTVGMNMTIKILWVELSEVNFNDKPAWPPSSNSCYSHPSQGIHLHPLFRFLTSKFLKYFHENNICCLNLESFDSLDTSPAFLKVGTPDLYKLL